MSDLSLNIEFLINNPEVRAAADQVKAQLVDIAKTSDSQLARIVKAQIQEKQLREQVLLALKAEKDAILEIEKAHQREATAAERAARTAQKEAERTARVAAQEAERAARANEEASRRVAEAAAKTAQREADAARKIADDAAKQQQRLLEGVAKSSQGIRFSIAQLTRELPAFTYSAQTGFMAVANNIPMLGDEIKRLAERNRELAASGQQTVPVWRQLVSGLLSWNTVISLGITLLTVFGKEIGNWISNLFKGKSSLDAVKQSMQNLLDVQKAYLLSLAKETSSLQTLLNTAKNEKLTKDQREEAIRRINKLSPEYLGNITLESIKTNEATRAINDYIAALKRKSVEEAVNSKRQDLVKNRLDLRDEYNKAKSEVEKYQGLVKNQKFKIPGQTETTAVEDRLAEKQKAFQKVVQKDLAIVKQIENLDAYMQSMLEKDIVPEKNKKDRAYYEDIISNNQKALDSLDSAASDFDKKASGYKAKIKEAKQKLKLFDAEDKQAEAANKKAESEFASIIAGRKAMQEKITALDNEYKIKSFQSDEEEIAALKEKFRKFREIVEKENESIKKFNDKQKDPKKKVKLLDVGQVNKTEVRAVGDLTAKQAVEKEKIVIDKQKQLFEQYENFKSEFGKQKADERFAKDLKGYTDYVSFIKAQIADLKGKNDAGSNALKDFYNKELPSAEKAAADKAFDEHLKNLKRIQDAIKTAASEEKRINEQYDKDLATLRLSYIGDELAAKEAALSEHHKTELEGVKRLAFDASEVGKALAVDLFFKTRKELEAELVKLKSLLSTAGLTPGQKTALKGQIGDVKKMLGDSNDFASVAAKFADAANQIASSLIELGDAIGGQTGYAIGQAGSLLNIAGSAAGSVTSFMTGDIIGGTTKALQTVAGLISMGKKVKEMNAAARAEVQKFYDNAQRGEDSYQAQLRERERQILRINALTTKGILDEQAGLKKQADSLNQKYQEKLKQLQAGNYVESMDSKHGTWFRKAKVTKNYASLAGMSFDQLAELDAQGKLQDSEKTLFDDLKKLKDEGADVEQALKDAKQAADELVTGTTVDSLASNIIDSLRAGKNGLQDVMDDYSEIIQNGLLSSFEEDVVKQELKGFYDRLAKAGQDGDGITKDEIEAAKNDYIATRERIKTAFDNLGQVTGIDLADNSGSSTDSSANKVTRAITEDTATEWIGIQRGVYDYQKRLYTLSQDKYNWQKEQMAKKLLLLEGIKEDTGKMVDTLESMDEKLETISKNQSQGTNLRGAGLGGVI